MFLNGSDIILDDEKYFGLSGDNVQCNQRFYTTDPSTTPSDVKYKKKKKYPPKILICMAMSARGVSDIYVHKSKEAIKSDIYLNECINNRLLPFIEEHHKNNDFVFWPDKASVHYAGVVLDRLKQKNIPVKVYANNWQAKDLDSLARRVKKKAKELDPKTLQAMVKNVSKQLHIVEELSNLDNKFLKLTDYILKNYIEHARFPIEKWNHFDLIEERPRTNNHVEGYHRQLNAHIGIHPSIWNWIMNIQKAEEITAIRVEQEDEQGRTNRKRRKQDVRHDIHLVSAKNAFANDEIDLQEFQLLSRHFAYNYLDVFHKTRDSDISTDDDDESNA
ncbi:unnamed protein product [Didymodactylos carnosus]|uniref:Uncharacterized protein n=1 Tax=Didymodactylos carnosus TaxID=1234261 RepID=A0A814RRH0_9BILA|nr:unnamed protein product [Didymodactylos carnosus]CAF3900137.1 unnamed protein product [Didymodactylos carnosus]